MSSSTASQIPILVVSGFLGSGKTTLVRDLLESAQREGIRLAILSNEFGALGIDRELLASGRARTVELKGGCVCCELSDEMVDTLEALRREVSPDRIVIETSGVALPYDVQLSLWRPPVSQWAGDDMAVVLVNAEQLAADGTAGEAGETFEQQVSAADLLILNQIDRVSEVELPALEARLRAIEPDVPIVRSSYARVDPRLLVPPALDPTAAGSGRVPRRRRPAAPHRHEVFATETLEFADAVEPEALIETLHERRPLRAKGFVRTGAGLALVQGVGRRIELHPVEAAPDALLGRVVLITRASPG
jgi:cobalamin biosynthesis protein CobW